MFLMEQCYLHLTWYFLILISFRLKTIFLAHFQALMVIVEDNDDYDSNDDDDDDGDDDDDDKDKGDHVDHENDEDNEDDE